MGSKMDIFILISAWVVTIAALLILIKKNKLIDAQISFLFMQVQTWLYGSFVVEKNLIEYPVDFMRYAYKASFSFEYFIFPATSAIYNVHYPKHRSRGIKFLYSLLIPALITIGEVLLETYTELIDYLNWSWYLSFITMWITLYISYRYYVWFMKKASNPT